MQLQNLTIMNFMPYKGVHKITFPKKAKQNVVLIFGDNMRGKTSLLNALRWVFFEKAWGRQLRPIGRIDIVNSDAASEGSWTAEVSVQFESEESNYDLRRIMTKNEFITSPKKNEDFDIQVGLKKNGEIVPRDKIEYELNQIIPENISRFFLFDGELLQEYEMLLMERSEQGQQIKEAIEQVLGVPALINCRNEIQALLKKARSSQLKDTRANEKFQMLNDEMGRLDNELEGLEKDKFNLGNQEAHYKKKIGKLDEELSASEGILIFKGDLAALESEQKNRIDKEKELNKKKLEMIGSAWKDLLQPRLQSKIEQLEEERDSYKQRIQKQGELQERVRIIKETIKKAQCIVCLAEIDNSRRNKLGSELGRIEGELESLSQENERLGEVSTDISRLSRIKSTGAAENIKVIEKTLNENNVRLTEIENKIQEISKKIKGYDTAELARKRSLKDQYLREVGKISANIQVIEHKIRENNDRQNQIAAIISRDPVSKKTKSSIQVEILNNLVGIFQEAVDRLRDTLRLRVAEYASNAFKDLTTEKTYKKLEINENYGLSIIDKNGQEVRERSAGAEQIVALSLIDGLNRTARKTGPIIMDTPLGRLDPKHRRNLISYMPKMAEQIVMLVHEGEISKIEVMNTLADRIAAIYEIERISSSQSRIVKI